MLRRNLTACCVLLAAELLLAGCNVSLLPHKTLTLQVTGTRGTQITGEYILVEGANTTRHGLDREVPFAIEVRGHDLSCFVQKLGGEGTVRIQLLVDGQPVAFGWTREPYGNVTVDTP